MAAGCSVGSCQNREHLVHHLFLSFRGEDVRKSFIDDLRSALNQKGITAFCDDKELERDDEIRSELYEAIESSKIAVVTFSSTYAASRGCLDELVKIMERRSDGLIVLHMFYDVDPTTVRRQSGPYQETFQGQAKYEGKIHRVTKWREELTSAADLVRFNRQNKAVVVREIFFRGHEAEVIEQIVEEFEVVLQKSGIELGCPPLLFTSFPSSLKRLILSNCDISRDDVMEMISCTPSLEHLDLSCNPVISVIAPTYRGPCLKLRSLILDGCPKLKSVSDILQGCYLSAKHCDSLTRITFYKQNTIKGKQRQLIETNDCQKLVQIEYRLSGATVIEPTSEMKEERAMHLGFPDLNSFDFKNMGCDESESGIYQAGMYCLYLGGDHMTKWFPTETTFRGESVVRYRVPSCYPNKRPIRALNVGFVGTEYSYTLVIKNVSRMWKWIYSQPCMLPFGGEEMEEEVTWFTHWYVTEHRQITPGDLLEISASGCESLGVKVIYEEKQHIDGEGAKDEPELYGTRNSVGSSISDDNNLSKVMNSSNISTSEDEEDSDTISDVAVWYNKFFRSQHLSLYLQKEVKQEKDEENSCEYHINPPLETPII